MAGANFSRVKTWCAEVLTYSDLNAEFDNILTNLTPSGIDDESVNDAAAQATSDPYPAAALSKATSLQTEIQQLRYLIKQITGEAQWYIDPDTTIAALNQGQNPPGTVLPYAGATAPAGYLLCYGQAVSRTTYAALFAIVGETYGAGDASTTFNVPDLRGRFPLGKDNMGGSSANRVTDTDADVLGGAGGEETKDISHTHAPGTLASTAHYHKVGLGRRSDGAAAVYVDSNYFPAATYSTNVGNGSVHISGSNVDSGNYYEQGNTAASGVGINSGATASGGSATQDVMPPFITLNYIIKT